MKRANSVLLAIVIVIQIALLSGCSPKKVEDMDFVLTYDGVTYSGKYTGESVKKVPNGQGTFVGKFGADEIEYTGLWNSGELSGVGSLNTTHYVMTFDDTIRVGSYVGAVLDGRASGEGQFVTENDVGVKYTHTGEFNDGLMDGQGKRIFDDEDYLKLSGNFSKGKFIPSLTEGVQAFSTDRNFPFRFNDNAKDFTTKHEKLFMGGSISTSELDGVTDAELTYSAFSKRPQKYGDLLVHWSNLTVFQTQSSVYFETDYEFTLINAKDKNGNICSIYFIDEDSSTSTLPINAGTRISFYALPLDYATYKNIDGGDTWTAYLLGAYLTYKN